MRILNFSISNDIVGIITKKKNYVLVRISMVLVPIDIFIYLIFKINKSTSN